MNDRMPCSNSAAEARNDPILPSPAPYTERATEEILDILYRPGTVRAGRTSATLADFVTRLVDYDDLLDYYIRTQVCAPEALDEVVDGERMRFEKMLRTDLAGSELQQAMAQRLAEEDDE